MGTVEDFTYIEAPPPLVFRLVSDLARQQHYFPRGLRYMRALTPTTNDVGARVEIMVQLIGPIWRTYILQLHAVEAGRAAVIGTPDAASFMLRWRLDPEPPGTLATLTIDHQVPGLLGARLGTVLRRTCRDLLQKLRGLAEEQNPSGRR